LGSILGLKKPYKSGKLGVFKFVGNEFFFRIKKKVINEPNHRSDSFAVAYKIKFAHAEHILLYLNELNFGALIHAIFYSHAKIWNYQVNQFSTNRQDL
jgi:hypothetical protein